MRPEDKTRILKELETRLTADYAARAEGRGRPLREVLEDSIYFERRRLKDERHGKARESDTVFWDSLQKELRHAASEEERACFGRAVMRYANEIAGNFDERVYQVVTKALPPALGLLLNAVSPMKLAKRLPHLPSLDDAIVIQGEIEHLKRLHERGTVILVPTHVSNMDSIVIGFGLYRVGLPPFIYGAGLNLFTNPLLSYFMHNLGAYTVDRKKQDPLYKEVLKEYATLTLENGYDNLFFPGGTRARSGAIERRLKLGLLGTGVQAYIHNLARGAPTPKIYIVPATLSFQLVLEAETLIDDFLKEVGKARYIIDDDEFTKPKRVFDFVTQLLALDSKIHITFSRACDPFGNPVDDDGNSLDPCGRVVDTARYVLKGGAPGGVTDRDAEYTREVGLRITEAYTKDNVVESTHVLARVAFDLLRQYHPKMDVLRVIRTSGEESPLEMSLVYRETENLMARLRDLSSRHGIRLGPSLRGSPEDIVADGLKHFEIYHTKNAVTRRGTQLIPTDRTLLLYYQNRLEGYELNRHLGMKPVLAGDHRSLVLA